MSDLRKTYKEDIQKNSIQGEHNGIDFIFWAKTDDARKMIEVLMGIRKYLQTQLRGLKDD